MLTRSAAKAFSTSVLKVVNDVVKQQFLVSMRGKEAVINYEQSGKNITFVRTEVPSEFQGKGVGKLLAKHAFDYALEKKLDVICQCHFLADFYERHKTTYKSVKLTIDYPKEEGAQK